MRISYHPFWIKRMEGWKPDKRNGNLPCVNLILVKQTPKTGEKKQTTHQQTQHKETLGEEQLKKTVRDFHMLLRYML